MQLGGEVFAVPDGAQSHHVRLERAAGLGAGAGLDEPVQVACTYPSGDTREERRVRHIESGDGGVCGQCW